MSGSGQRTRRLTVRVPRAAPDRSATKPAGTADTYLTVHLWIERPASDVRARVRSALLPDDQSAVASGLEEIQALLARIIENAAISLWRGGH